MRNEQMEKAIAKVTILIENVDFLLSEDSTCELNQEAVGKLKAYQYGMQYAVDVMKNELKGAK